MAIEQAVQKTEERMAAREKAEWERERKLILDGKVKLRKEHLKKEDPLLKLHHEKLQMKRKASKGSRSPKPSLNRKSMTSGIPGADSTTSFLFRVKQVANQYYHCRSVTIPQPQRGGSRISWPRSEP